MEIKLLLLLIMTLLTVSTVSAAETVFMHLDNPLTDSGRVVTEKDYMKEHNIKYSNILTKNAPNPDYCTSILYNGKSASKLDIVFVAAHNYETVGDGSKFSLDVEKFIQRLEAFPQFAENMDKMNIWRVDLIDEEDGCQVYGIPGQYSPSCNNIKIQEIAKNCEGFSVDNNDQIAVIFDAASYQDILYSVAVPEYKISYNPSWNPRSFTHELGHTFAGLGDEYNGNYIQPSEPNYPNVASMTPGYTCQEKWGEYFGINGVSCFQNANGINWYRPTQAGSTMRYSSLTYFCPVSEAVVDEKFSIYSTRKPSPITEYRARSLPVAN